MNECRSSRSAQAAKTHRVDGVWTETRVLEAGRPGSGCWATSLPGLQMRLLTAPSCAGDDPALVSLLPVVRAQIPPRGPTLSPNLTPIASSSPHLLHHHTGATSATRNLGTQVSPQNTPRQNGAQSLLPYILPATSSPQASPPPLPHSCPAPGTAHQDSRLIAGPQRRSWVCLSRPPAPELGWGLCPHGLPQESSRVLTSFNPDAPAPAQPWLSHLPLLLCIWGGGDPVANV